ncbi:MAG: flagellar basal-body rod protein FlgF [Magnetospirillum sp. WYHS-4]
MENTGYIALSRQATLRREMDVIANNLANIKTSGFKGEKMMFIEHLVRSRGGDGLLGHKVAFVRDISTVRDYSPGHMEQTNNPLDVAINGEGFFTVDTPEGPRYTRVGRFSLDPAGRLVNLDGHSVLSQTGQPFTFGPQDTEITISRDGTVATNSGPLGRLSLVNFENPQKLREVAGGLYDTDQEPQRVERGDVAQYMLEGSNVEPILEITRMIDVSRSYSSVKSLMDKEHERIRKMAEELSRAA